jgi:hypothetical protein
MSTVTDPQRPQPPPEEPYQVPGTGSSSHRSRSSGSSPSCVSRLPFVALPLTQSRYVATNIL